MTDSSQPARPQQVTTAVVLSVAACVLAVVNLFSARDQLRGTSLRDTIAEAQEGIGGLAPDDQVVLRVLEALVFVSGALAAAAAVLAVYAWQRNRAAWIGFFVLAGLLALTLPVAGVLPVLLLAAGATFLASRPAREWFSDRAPRERAQVAFTQPGAHDGAASGERPQPAPYPGRFGGGASADPPPAYGPWHGVGEPGPAYPTPGSATGGPGGPGRLPDRDPQKRPGTVTAACVLTWVGSALVLLVLALVALVLLADRGRFVREFRRQADLADLRVSQDQVLAAAWTLVGIGAVWCLAAAVLAVFAFRRSRGGRVGLAVSAAVTVLVSLLLVLSVVAVVPLLMGIAVLVLLFTGGANDWYARRGGWSPPPGGGPYGDPSYGQQPGQPYSQPYGQQPPPPPPPGRPGPW